MRSPGTHQQPDPGERLQRQRQSERPVIPGGRRDSPEDWTAENSYHGTPLFTQTFHRTLVATLRDDPEELVTAKLNPARITNNLRQLPSRAVQDIALINTVAKMMPRWRLFYVDLR